MKKINFLFLAMLLTTLASIAQNTIHITGFVFEKSKDKEFVSVPFASVYYYNYEDSTKLEYFAFTDLSGSYDLGKIPVQKYRIKIVAPGYVTRYKKIGNLPTEFPKDWKGDNMTFHFEMEKDPQNKNIIIPVVYPVKDLEKSSKDNFWDLIRHINDEFVVDEKSKSVTTKDGEPIRLMFNGFNMQGEKSDKAIALPMIAFKEIEYYDLSNQPASLYQYVLNIVLMAGDKAGGVLSFGPIETKKYDIE